MLLSAQQEGPGTPSWSTNDLGLSPTTSPTTSPFQATQRPGHSTSAPGGARAKRLARKGISFATRITSSRYTDFPGQQTHVM
jgi:hypothetical protein